MMALLCLRTTPVDHSLPSPAELLYTRKIKGNLPVRIRNCVTNRDSVYQRLKDRQVSQKQYFDQTARVLPELMTGQSVCVQDQLSKRWSPATVVQKSAEPRSYVLSTPSGSILRRNRRHILDVDQPVKRVRFEPETQPPAAVPGTCQPEVPNIQPDPGSPTKSCVTTDDREYRTRSGRTVKRPNHIDL